MKLSEKITLCRKKAGMSQLDLADLLGVSRQSVSKWETGEAHPDVSKIPALARAFGVTADWLLDEEAAPADPQAPAGPSLPAPYPQWVEKLPGHMLRMVKRYGWLYGLRTAAGGFLLLLFGLFIRSMSGQFFSAGGFSPFSSGMFHEFSRQGSNMFGLFSGFVMLVGAVFLLLGLGMAWALKKWGEKEE